MSSVKTDNHAFCPPTCGRSSWTGELVLGPIRVPVKAFAASVTSSSSGLHQIHVGCGQRIEQRKTCPIHGALQATDVGKAFDYAPEQQVILSNDELDVLQAPEDPTLRIRHVIASDELNLALLSGRTLLLVPANPVAANAYAIAVHVLQKQNSWGIGTAALSGRRQLVAVHALDDRLALHVLHWPAALRSAPDADIPKPTIDRGLANQIEASLGELQKQFEWTEYRDEYELRLTQLVSQKITAAAKPSKWSIRKSPVSIPAIIEPAKARRRKAA